MIKRIGSKHENQKIREIGEIFGKTAQEKKSKFRASARPRAKNEKNSRKLKTKNE